MFCREEGVKRYAGKSDPVDVMGHLRHDKDTFKAKHWASACACNVKLNLLVSLRKWVSVMDKVQLCLSCILT